MNNRKIFAIIAIIIFASAIVLSIEAISSAKVDKDLELKFTKKDSKGAYFTVKNLGRMKTPATKLTLSYRVKEKSYTKDYKVKSLKSGQSVRVLIPTKQMNRFKATKKNQKGGWAGSISLNYADNNYMNNHLSILYGKVGAYTFARAEKA